MSKKETKEKAMMDAVYSVSIPGAMLGYVLLLLSDEQRALDEEAAESIMDPEPMLMAATNSMVGSTLMHEVYRVAGAAFLACVMNTSEEKMRKFMEAKGIDSIDKAARDIAKGAVNHNRPKGSHLN